MAYDVAERTREIGIRMALGANRTDVLRVVLRDVLVMTSVGAVIGIGLAQIAATAMARLFFNVHPLDPISMAASLVALSIAGTLAVLAPAERACRLNPTEAVRA